VNPATLLTYLLELQLAGNAADTTLSAIPPVWKRPIVSDAAKGNGTQHNITPFVRLIASSDPRLIKLILNKF
jgi:hypothetical protein